MTDDYGWGTWPPSQAERDLRDQHDAAEALVVSHEARDGRVPCSLVRVALGMPRRERGGHGTVSVEGIVHGGDCLGTLCPDCGCCCHCADDGHCQGCDDRALRCGCSL